jgi:shikimate dehydrogenase
MSETLKFGVIGQDISYSKSRDVFEAVFRLTGSEGVFDIISVEPSELEAVLRRQREEGCKGLSVTIPYKERVIRYLDELDPVASTLEAVNSVAFGNNKMVGANTDCHGFAVSLKEHTELVRRGPALILGCGGAARAAAHSLIVNFEVGDIVVVGRSTDRLAEFKNALSGISSRTTITTITFDNVPRCTGTYYGVIVNSTPLGGWNCPEQTPLPASLNWSSTRVYFDLNYNSDNAIVSSAREAGLIAMDGSLMLVAQALRSYEIWTGQSVAVEPVYRAVFGNV